MHWAAWISWFIGGGVLALAIAWALAAHWEEHYGDNHF